jgi:hypothetical protein
MDEARQVIERLGRIDALRSAGAEPRALLAELRELVREGQAWLGAEGRDAVAASVALGSLAGALERGDGLPGPPGETEGVVLTNAAL